MPLKTDSIEEPGINLTPMIDIVFLLLIFFMVGTRFTELEREFKIQLPSVSEAQPLTSLPDEITINVSSDGELRVDGIEMTLQELENRLQTAKKHYSDQSVIVRGDANGTYQNVMDVLAACNRSGIQAVSLANRLSTKDR
jgi:biopolymer transport protein ExbD